MKYIKIVCDSKEEEKEVSDKIHQQLVGYQDYIDGRILLCYSIDNSLELYFDNCKEDIPEIRI